MPAKPGASGKGKPSRKKAVAASKSKAKSKAKLSKSSPRRSAKREKSRLDLSPKGVQKLLAKQRQQRREALQRKKAVAARKHFKVRKSDKGKLILIGVKGQRNPQSKGRKGYLVYVTKTGKKRLIKQPKNGFKPATLKQVEIPIRRNLKTAVKQWQKRRRETVGKGRTKRPVTVQLEQKVKTGGAYDFNDKIVNKLAKAFQTALESRKSHRDFIITTNVTVALPDGSTKVYTFDVPLQRGDHRAIKLAGVKHFVERKFYAFLARELAFDGYVTAGSANHVRRLADNLFADSDDWVQDDGEAWRGIGMDVVTIQEIEWRIEQATQ